MNTTCFLRNINYWVFITVTLIMMHILCGESISDPLIEKEIHRLANEFRAENGLAPLGFSDVVSQVARQHSINMANQITPFGHSGFTVLSLRTNIPTRSIKNN